MKRFLLGIAASMCAVVALLGVSPAAGAQSVNNFSVQSFRADYYLQRQIDGRPQLKTVEKITALFPNYDQNHGIERALPKTYNRHSVALRIDSITDEKGAPLQFSTYNSNGNEVLRIGDAHSYAHGPHMYVLTYSQQDVTQQFADHDELYWDVNGTEWSVPFESVEAHLHIPQTLVASLNGRYACYVGRAGSGDKNCLYSQASEGQGKEMIFRAGRQLGAGENLTYVVGFHQGTFQSYKKPLSQIVVQWLIIGWFTLGGIVCIGVVLWSVRVWRRHGRAPAGKGTIVPEYKPPKGLSVLKAATMLGKGAAACPPQIIDLAIRGYIRITDAEVKGFIRAKHIYTLELRREADDMLQPEERQLLDVVFNTNKQVPLNELGRIYSSTKKIMDTVLHTLVEQQYYVEYSGRKRVIIAAVGFLAGGIFLLNPGFVLAAVVLFITASRLRPLSAAGVAIKEHLLGLQMYMQMAEADRMRFLQSPQGAERIDITDKKQLVKLYEKLLPYAMLFGIEKEWAQKFASLYEQPPEWYAGNWTTFNAAVFVGSLHGFTQNSMTAFAPPSSSSSSGFSGGSSGGGGGGGGGGGW